ncbi:MAG: substrate-binding domain-containing protein, partial [Planctomycetota bacterium]
MNTLVHISDRLGRTPFPKRGATQELERRVVDYLCEQRPAPGSPLGTDREIVDLTRLSRSTVRRVMERLDRDGWVDRHAGRGTFVGKRVLLLDEIDAGPEAMRDDKHSADELAIQQATMTAVASRESDERSAEVSIRSPRKKTLRIAVLISRIEDLSHDWFSLGVISGLDAAAAEHGGQIELIGTREARPDVLADRLRRTRPDALAYLAWKPEYLSLVEVGHRVGFPTIFANTAFARPNWTHSVCEDNTQAVEIAVEALWEAGHRRIGLAINRWPEPWVFERHRAFENAIRRRSGVPLGLQTAWLDSAVDLSDEGIDRNNEAMVDRLAEYLAVNRPTALVSASEVTSDVLSRLITRGGISVPNDLSVVCIDQPPDLPDRLGVEPTVVCLALDEIGRGLYEAAE